MVCNCIDASARRGAVGGTDPGFWRAWPRTKIAALATASAAMPHQSDAHRMCEYGTMVWAELSQVGGEGEFALLAGGGVRA